MTAQTYTSASEPPSDRPFRGRRLTPDEFFRLTGRRLKAANDNEPMPDTKEER